MVKLIIFNPSNLIIIYNCRTIWLVLSFYV